MLIVMYLEYKSVELTSDLSSHAGGARGRARSDARKRARTAEARRGAEARAVLDAGVETRRLESGGVEGTLCELSCLSVLV